MDMDLVQIKKYKMVYELARTSERIKTNHSMEQGKQGLLFYT